MQDQGRPSALVIGLSALLVVALAGAVIGGVSLLTGGGAQPATGEAPSLLPRVVITVDEQGTPSVFGVSLKQVGSLIGMDLSTAQFPPQFVQQMTSADIQHIEFVIAEPGVFPFVNSEPLPYLAADDEAWATLKQIFAIFQVPNQNAINWVLDNIVPRFGVQVAIKFPVQQGTAEIPLRDSASLSQVSVEEQRAGVDARSTIAYADVDVDANGVPAVGGLSLGALQEGFQEAGMAVDLSTARLDPGMVAMLTTANVQHMQVETEPEGLYSYLNGMRLPRLTYDAVRLQNAISFYQALDPASPYLPLVQALLPGIQPSDLEVTVFLPKQSGAADVNPAQFISIQ